LGLYHNMALIARSTRKPKLVAPWERARDCSVQGVPPLLAHASAKLSSLCNPTHQLKKHLHYALLDRTQRFGGLKRPPAYWPGLQDGGDACEGLHSKVGALATKLWKQSTAHGGQLKDRKQGVF